MLRQTLFALAVCLWAGTLAAREKEFAAHLDYDVGSAPNSVAMGDFNGDGNLDLATANAGAQCVSVLLGNGDGSFQAHADYETGQPFSVAVGDLNGDGKPDLATANFYANTVS